MDADIIAALNGLLEEERADAETLVGLVAMATETLERQALTAMGGQAAQGCIDLHERLARLGAPISGRVSHSVVRVLEHERIDDRLRAFGEVQRYLAGRCEALRERNLDDETRALLGALREVQLAHATWAEHRADEFAATRPTDVETSSPSHSVPRGERPLATGTVEEAPGQAPSVELVVDEVVVTEAPAVDYADHADDADGGTKAVSAPDETPQVGAEDMVASDEMADGVPGDMVAGDSTAPERELGDAGSATVVAAPKPRARRTRVGAPTTARRATKKP